MPPTIRGGSGNAQPPTPGVPQIPTSRVLIAVGAILIGWIAWKYPAVGTAILVGVGVFVVLDTFRQ